MSVLLRLAVVAAADLSVAFDNLLFGNKHNMTSFCRLVITVIKNVRVFVFVCARSHQCVCVCQNISIRNYKSVCVCGGEKEEAEPLSDNVCLWGLFCTGSLWPCAGVTSEDKEANNKQQIKQYLKENQFQVELIAHFGSLSLFWKSKVVRCDRPSSYHLCSTLKVLDKEEKKWWQ